MDGKKFSEAYQGPATGRFHPDSDKVELFKGAHQWSDRFSELTHDILQNNQPSPDTSLTLLRSYTQWSDAELGNLVTKAWDMQDEYDEQNAEKLNFHLLNMGMIALWKHVLVDQRNSIPTQLARSVQSNLAFRAVSLMQTRLDGIERGDFYSDELSVPRQRYLGLLNEFDTGIVTQEVSLQNPSIVVLPAASQFESSHDKAKNSDFLAIDLRQSGTQGERQVRGIQAKLSVTQEAAELADQAYVTLVDGVVDLGSTKTYRPYKHKSLTIMKQWPGLIAAHHLLATKNVDVLPNAAKVNLRRGNNKAALVQAMQLTQRAMEIKARASAHTDSTKSNNKNAARIVAQRVVGDLYK